MFLTTSMLEPTKYGASVDQLRVRLGLPITEDSLGFLRNTCMNPFQCTQAFITAMGKMFRNVVLNCIGGVGVAVSHNSHNLPAVFQILTIYPLYLTILTFYPCVPQW